jgi:sugar/nucleoside kinase (ribokinase family)
MVNRLLRRRPLDEVAAFANQVGAYVASQPGATPPYAQKGVQAVLSSLYGSP